MRRIFAFLCAGAAVPLAGLFGQSTTPSDQATGGPPPPATSSAPAKPAPAMSADTAAMLAATMPKYEPPKPAKPATPPEQQVDLREIDKPKNGIIRLPKYVVHAEAPPIFREQDLYTKEGLDGLAMMRYAGLRMFPGAQLNIPIAEELYREDSRLKSMEDLDQTAQAMAAGGNTAESQYILRQSQDTYGHVMDFGGPVPYSNQSDFGNAVPNGQNPQK